MIAQDEGFEEPCRVREMPFGVRSVGHRLRARVGVGEGPGEIEREAPGRHEAPAQRLDRVGAGRSGGAAGHVETIPRGAIRFRGSSDYGYSPRRSEEHTSELQSLM